MIGGNTREESSIRLQKQAHVKRESHELEEDDGAYVSKPGTNACMAFNHKSLHICFFFGSLQEETLIHSNKIEDEEKIIELILKQQEEKIIMFKPCHQAERHRASGKRESPEGTPGSPIYKIDFLVFD